MPVFIAMTPRAVCNAGMGRIPGIPHEITRSHELLRQCRSDLGRTREPRRPRCHGSLCLSLPSYCTAASPRSASIRAPVIFQRMSRICTPTSSAAHAWSAVMAGAACALARARQARSPSERPQVRT
jgi:hypothetical protein